ncbi:MAG: hypothetical protein HQL48_05795 [Gammaproteobacteria bacterium]|nr:hypothetical protein [Gammaproteobacteria bacterium]
MKSLHLWLGTAWILWLTTVSAEDRLYDIELILFQQPGSEFYQDEHWGSEAPRQQTANRVELLPYPRISRFSDRSGSGREAPSSNQPVVAPTPYAILPPEEYLLTSLASRLRRQREYRLLLHTAWRQRLTTGKTAPPIHLYDSLRNEVEVAVDAYQGEEELASPTPHPGGDASGSGSGRSFVLREAYQNALQRSASSSPAYFDGTVTITLGRYLHLAFDLDYLGQERAARTQPLSPRSAPVPLKTAEVESLILSTGSGEMPISTTLGMDDTRTALPPRISLRQSRKMRSREIHLIDHPMLGILALITPVDNNS